MKRATSSKERKEVKLKHPRPTPYLLVLARSWVFLFAINLRPNFEDLGRFREPLFWWHNMVKAQMLAEEQETLV